MYLLLYSSNSMEMQTFRLHNCLIPSTLFKSSVVYIQPHAQVYFWGCCHVCSRLFSITHCESNCRCPFLYTLLWQDTTNSTGLYTGKFTPVYLIERPAELQITGTKRCQASQVYGQCLADRAWTLVNCGWQILSGSWCMAAEILLSVNIMVWTSSLVWLECQDLKKPHSDGNYNYSLRF